MLSPKKRVMTKNPPHPPFNSNYAMFDWLYTYHNLQILRGDAMRWKIEWHYSNLFEDVSHNLFDSLLDLVI